MKLLRKLFSLLAGGAVAHAAEPQGLRTLQMGRVAVDVFRDLEVRDDDGTLVAFTPQTDFANLRCSVISILKDGREVSEAGEKEVRERAEKAKGEVRDVAGKLVFQTEEPSSEDPKSIVHYWYVGLGGHLAIVSLFIDHVHADDPRTKHVRDCADVLIRSLRRVE